MGGAPKPDVKFNLAINLALNGLDMDMVPMVPTVIIKPPIVL